MQQPMQMLQPQLDPHTNNAELPSLPPNALACELIE